MIKYLKNVWNDLINDESGQFYGIPGGYYSQKRKTTPTRLGGMPLPTGQITPKKTAYSPYYARTQAELLNKRYRAFITSPTAAQKFAASEAGKLEQLYRQKKPPVQTNQPPAEVYKPPATVYNPVGGGGDGAGAGYTPIATPAATYTETPAAASNFEIDLAGIWEQAGQTADNQINPQLSEIDRLLQEAGYSAGESQRAINEAYPVARRSLQKSIYENMVAGEQGLAAMGTGRGGGRQELLARAGEREATGLETIETQKQREVGAIQRALGQYQGKLGGQRTVLVGQRGGLQAAYAEQLRGARFGEAATRANYGLNAAQLAENKRQFDTQMAENVRQFNTQMAENQRRYNESLATASSQPYANNTNETPYILTPEVVESLVPTSTYVTPTSTKKYGVPYTSILPGIQTGRPRYLQKLQMSRW